VCPSKKDLNRLTSDRQAGGPVFDLRDGLLRTDANGSRLERMHPGLAPAATLYRPSGAYDGKRSCPVPWVCVPILIQYLTVYLTSVIILHVRPQTIRIVPRPDFSQPRPCVRISRASSPGLRGAHCFRTNSPRSRSTWRKSRNFSKKSLCKPFIFNIIHTLSKECATH
jgi:hypothetical protein